MYVYIYMWRDRERHQNATVDSTHCRHCTLFTVVMQQEEAQGLVEPHGHK